MPRKPLDNEQVHDKLAAMVKSANGCPFALSHKIMHLEARCQEDRGINDAGVANSSKYPVATGKADYNMSDSNKSKHLTLDERRIILTGITNGSTKTDIANILGKDKSTIGKEIKLHRECTYKCKLPLECDSYRKCKFDRECTADCPDYKPFKCSRRDRSPGACNGCKSWNCCRFNKFKYNPEHAQREYEETLVDSRQGINLTSKEAKEIADIIAPLLKQGQSPYHIVTNHPEIGICEKTLYNYIEDGIFQEMSDITVMSLRRQVSRRIPKKRAADYKKRKDSKHLKDRTYADYNAYIHDHPDSYVVQMDTVYNDVSNGPFIQTFKFINCGLLFAILHDEKTASTMKAGVELLESVLGNELFSKHVEVLLTDRGSEFTDADGIETRSDNSKRTHLFYCDPMMSGQKGSLENNHEALRYILEKGTDLRSLGLTNQDKLNLVLSHVNSIPLEKQGGKTPLEMTEFLYPELYNKLNEFGIKKIEKDKVTLKPYLLK